jgi:hypothetical protein
VSDEGALVAVVALFAVALTSHVAIAFGLLRRAPRWQAAVAFVAPPLAPYWAVRAGMPLRAVAWVAAVVGYVTVRWLFRR